MPRTGQIPIRFPEAQLNFDQMAITSANRSICAAVRKPDRWPYHAFCLIGPAGSGVSTLANAWAVERNARFVEADALNNLVKSEGEQLTMQDLVVDDVDTMQEADALLMVLSGIQRHGHYILLAGHSVPANWRVSSPDLNSRLQGAPLAEIPAPDEELMRARLQRAFARSYLNLPKSVEDYLVTRLGLDYSLIEQSAETLAGASGERALTIPLVREILDEP
jgi:chromosomal replication initiation ATPase DnaA